MIIAVDFDGTLALGNKSHISILQPNTLLIKKLNVLREKINPIIKITTARGSKSKLSELEKIFRYHKHIEDWLKKYNVPYDAISFNKEYAAMYIDDMTINPFDDFEAFLSPFTKNKIIMTQNSVIKYSKKALYEFEWYKMAATYIDIPKTLFCNDELIITERIHSHKKPNADELIMLITKFKSIKGQKVEFESYLNNITPIKYSSNAVKELKLPMHEPTFYHGDLSTTNVLVTDKAYCIDPNHKNIFGSYLTDAGKSYFSLIAYEQNYVEANKIAQAFGNDVIKYAVAEGLRVCKYKEKYISIVNNIADLI